ncbi:peptide-methionine (S)-S-oxide reductase MsrA [Nevskia soli]|uniref:peptide-methionine (S)-S-oxide reductase MsrA n=1 Tax=Nevskia soli TaxID=418856 RepID=UPI0004A6EA6D|nr:peptide-methionine (S)-S-oxide reductase MsrA [Nevskia soli]
MRPLIAALFALVLPLQAAHADVTPAKAEAKTETATFAGGCFWCMVPPFKNLPGVISVTSGYTGGHVANPSYEEVSSGKTGHAESVQVVFDPTKVGYAKLLDVFWHNIDPTTPQSQFCDVGDQYRTAVFYHGEEQQKLAIASRDALQASGVVKGPIVTQIVPASTFYPAEEAHQDFYIKNEVRYQIYRHGCGRDQRLKELYGDKSGGH